MDKKISITVIAILILAVCALPGGVGAQPVIQVEKDKMAPAFTFTVNSSADDASAHDAVPGNGVCADGMLRCTLRAAIEEVNAKPGADAIDFSGPRIIYMDTSVGALPSITEQLRIDASGVWNAASNQPGVTINGNDQSLDGLVLLADSCEVYGLFVVNFSVGIEILSANNTIGGTSYGQRNVISSNGSFGVAIHGASAHHNLVQGNWIGLSITGESKQPNFSGVRISGGAYENTIGGTVIGSGNVISGNTYNGIEITGTNSNGNEILGNNIGQAAIGSQDVGNGGTGVYIMSGPQDTQIGSGVDPFYGNFIANNGGSGVGIWDADGNWVEQNNIVENSGDGVTIKDSSGNYILSNVITANMDNGVYVDGITAVKNAILNNSIYQNGEKGIDLINGGNNELTAPIIVDANTSGASGTGCAGCWIYLYSDSADEGEFYEDRTIADGVGQWSIAGPFSGPYVTATNTDADGNTSEFSSPWLLNHIYLPIIMINF